MEDHRKHRPPMPDQDEPYGVLVWLSCLFGAALAAVVLPFPPWITFGAFMALVIGERLLLRPRRR